MKVTIDLAQSPKALEDELARVIRMALGLNYFIDKRESGNFTEEELSDPNVNMPAAASALGDLIAPITGATVTLPAVTSQATGSSGVDLDSEGQPWDVSIHSTGKTKLQSDGTWKLKKGVDKTLVDQVKARNAGLVSNVAPITPPSNVVSLPNLPALPTLPPVAQVAAPDVEINVTDYASLAAFVGQQMAAKPKATKENCDKGLAHYGLVDAAGNPDLTAMAHKPEVVMPFYQWLKAVINLAPAE